MSIARRFCSAVKKPATIDLFYDVMSPYSWFAFECLLKKKDTWNININWKPVFLAGITKETGNSAPMLVPNKGKYMVSDLKRNAQYFGVPLKVISIETIFELFMEKGSIVPMRYLTALQQSQPDKLIDASRALWFMLWNKGEDFTSPEAVVQAFRNAGVSGETIADCQNLVKTSPIKDKLKTTTQEAIDLGAFGVPTVVIRNPEDKDQLFFGSDRFHLIAQELGEKWDGPEAKLIEEVFKSKF